MCLGQEDKVDLKEPLRKSENNDLLKEKIYEAISKKPKGHDFVIERKKKNLSLDIWVLLGDNIFLMEIQLKLYGSSKQLSDSDFLQVQLPENANIENLRDCLNKLVIEKKLNSNLGDLSKTAAFFSDKDEVVSDKYKLKNKELISVIPPIGGG